MNRLPAVLAALPLLAGCAGEYTGAEEREARRIANDPSIYASGKGTPAEFITNKCYYPGITCATVRRGPGPDYAECVRKVAGFGRDIGRGFAWRESRRRLCLPELAAAPRLDGIPEADEWSAALLFTGEYPLDEVRKNAAPSRWRLGLRAETLYVAVEFTDRSLTIHRGRSQRSARPLYTGDSLELFLRPDNRHPCYYELLVNPAGDVWAMRHAAKETGSWRILDESFDSGVRAAARITPDGYSIELAVPLNRLYIATPGDTNGTGREFSLMLIRTDRDGEAWNRSTPVPLLYDGHNIFGYMIVKPAPGV